VDDQGRGEGGAEPAADLAAELARARERVAFYESFDRVIQENIARSAELLRQAAAERERAAREAAAARAELDRRTGEQRATLVGLGADLAALQAQAAALGERVAAAIDGIGGEPAPGSAEPVEAEVPSPAVRRTTVILHGVPKAAAALSLQHYLAGLPDVDAVEAREYVAGVLRLQVDARAPLAVDDLRRWEGGGALEAVNVLPDLIELRFGDPAPGAGGR